MCQPGAMRASMINSTLFPRRAAAGRKTACATTGFSGVGSSVRIDAAGWAGAEMGLFPVVGFERLLACGVGADAFSQPRTEPSTIPPTIHTESSRCIEDLLAHLC